MLLLIQVYSGRVALFFWCWWWVVDRVL